MTYISNVKIHFVLPNVEKLKTKLQLLDCGSVVCHHNFIVLRYYYTYIIFFDSGHVNATKISGLNHCTTAVELLYNLLHIDIIRPIHVVIDNITAAGSFGNTVNLHNLKLANNLHTVSIKYNNSIFPGAVCKINNLCTIIVFTSGNYTCVGAKCVTQIYLAYEKLAAIIREL